jgi:hypothetical protein
VVSKFVLQPGQVSDTKVPFAVGKGKVLIADAMSGKHTVYAYGHVDYGDIFGRRWSSAFCFVYEPQRPQGSRFIPYETNNYEKQLD